MIGIYKIENIINGKCYIGQTNDIERRWKEHKTKQPNTYIYRALKKYGVDAFTFEVLIECPIESLDFFEKAFILGYDSFGLGGYNLTEGGEGTRGRKHSEETKEKIGKSNKGKIRSEETCNNISISKTGLKHSDEHKMKIGLAGIGRTHTDESRLKMSEAQKGRIFSEETKKKMSESAKNKPAISDETRKKLSESATNQWIRQHNKANK
jgi:group I intron endonuclease